MWGYYTIFIVETFAIKYNAKNMEKQEKKSETRQVDDPIIFIPQEEFYTFRNVLEMTKDAQRELHKVAESMKLFNHI